MPTRFTGLIFLGYFWFAHKTLRSLVKSNLLHNSKKITSPTQSCLVSYSFVLVTFPIYMIYCFYFSPQNLHLLFYGELSVFALVYLVPMALFCTAIRRISVTFLRFPSSTLLQVYSKAISSVCRLKTSCICSF